jgi:hypothetical protein
MNAVVVGSHRGQTARLLKHVGELVEQVVQQRVGEDSSHCTSRRFPNVVAGGTKALLEDAPRSSCEGHAQVLKVLEDGAKRAEEVNAEDDIEATEVDVIAVDGELLGADG